LSRPVGLYLGKAVDPTTGALGAEVRLDPADLTTHAVVIGMTGSGKTGLCIDLLEEAALAGIPTLAIDPKGDVGNLLLTFPDLRPEDFAPWLPPGEAERRGLTAQQYAEKVAESWRTGLAEWGLDGQRIRELREKAEITLYTPGSRSGVPVDVLSSFTPPDLSWETEEEALRESIRFSVSALLALLGIEADPSRAGSTSSSRTSSKTLGGRARPATWRRSSAASRARPSTSSASSRS
jgi:DNA helicase HerA-like ATPase